MVTLKYYSCKETAKETITVHLILIFKLMGQNIFDNQILGTHISRKYAR
jgi:hypothetical protein